MRILWFTNTPSNAAQEFGYKTFGGGWITSLEELIIESGEFELGICFFYHGENPMEIRKNNVVYYGIPFKKESKLKKIISRHLNRPDDEDSTYIDVVLREFKPDLIHVFGTEQGYGRILMNKSKKVLFHLQGLLGPITEVYFPPSFKKNNLLFASNLLSILKGYTYYHEYNKLKRWAAREQNIIKNFKYFSGRTGFDNNYIKLINPSASYFHCDELIRNEFYNKKWEFPNQIVNNGVVVIGTTINPSLYKGLDLVYKTISLINGYKIQWKIFGVKENDMYSQIIRENSKQRNNKGDIRFYGQLSSIELIAQLQTCHLFVHPSYIDNSPNSVCEAMILGMPVITSSVGGIKTLVKDGETGVLFNPYDKYDLAGVLVNALSNYKLMIQLGENARKVALKRHKPETILKDLTNIYNEIFHDNN